MSNTGTLTRAISNAIQSAAVEGSNVHVFDLTTGQAARAGRMRERLASGVRGAGVDLSNFAVWYTADALPQDSSPEWQAHLAGVVSQECDGGILDVHAGTDADSVMYVFSDARFTNAGGVTVEVLVRPTSTVLVANRGLALSVFDGVRQFVVWLRTNGFNVDGQGHVALPLSSAFHKVRLVTQQNACKVYVDGRLRQYGGPANDTSKQCVTFGTWVTPLF